MSSKSRRKQRRQHQVGKNEKFAKLYGTICSPETVEVPTDSDWNNNADIRGQLRVMIDRMTGLCNEGRPEPMFKLTDTIQGKRIVGIEWGPANWVAKNGGPGWAYRLVGPEGGEAEYISEAKLNERWQAQRADMFIGLGKALAGIGKGGLVSVFAVAGK